MVVESFFDSLAALLLLETLVGYKNLSIAVINLKDLNLKSVADFYRSSKVNAVVIRVLILSKNTVSLVSDVQNDLVRLNIDYSTFYYLSCMNCFE